MNTTTRHYELLYIVDSNLTDEQVEPIIAKYSAIATEQGGEVQAAGKWDKRRLAYEVNGHREGIYILMYFTGDPAVAKELDRILRISDDCFRHLITRVEPEHVDTTRIEQPQAPAEAVTEAPVAETVAEAPAEQPAEETPAETPTEEEAVEAPAEPAAEEAEAPVEEPAQEAEPVAAEEVQPEPEVAEPTEETSQEEPKAAE